MSQAGSLLGNAPVGAGILTATGNNGIPVGPNVLGDIQIIGAGDITVTGNAGTNTLTITSAALATDFHTDGGNAAPAAGILNILGTANQISTAGAGNTVTISLPNDVTIPGTFQALNITATANLGCVTLAAIGDALVGGDLGVTGQIVSATGNIIATTGDVGAIRGIFSGDVFGASINTPGNVVATGNGTFGGTVTADNVSIGTNLTLPATATSGVLFKAAGGLVSSSPGTMNGQVIICDVANGPAWALLQAGNGIGITNLAGHSVTIGLNSNIVLPGNFQAATVTSTGLMTAGNGLSVTTGNAVISAGNLTVSGDMTAQNIVASGVVASSSATQGFVSQATVGNTAFYSAHGNIIALDGNIVAINGTLTGSNLIVTNNATISSFATPGVLSNTNTGLIQSSNGANGQLIIGGGAGPTWANLTAGAGIGITNGPNSITITNTGSGAVKPAFNIGLVASQVAATGDGTTVIFAGANLAAFYDTTGAFNIGTGRFTAAVAGVYQFMMQIDYTIDPTYAPDGWFNTFYIYTTTRTFTYADQLASAPLGTPTFSGQYLINTYLTAGQQARFGFKCVNYIAPADKICTINNLNTFLTGFQVS